MTKEEELQFLKGLVVENLEKSRKRALRSSLVLVAMILISATSMTYAWIQQTKAAKARNEAIANAEEAMRQKRLSELNLQRAVQEEDKFELTSEALKRCEESKKKK